MKAILTIGLCAVSGIALWVCFFDLKQHLSSVSDQHVTSHGNNRNVDGMEDQVRTLYTNEYNSLAYGKKSNYCKDSTGSFIVRNNRAKRMTCDDLRRPDYLFACTWSEVRKNCPYSCDSCSHDSTNNNDDDYGSEYIYNPDDDYSHSNHDYNNPTHGNTDCRDVEGKFRLTRDGEFIKCHMLRSRAYSDKCAWLRIQRKCPETCNVPCNSIHYNNNINRPSSNTVFRERTRGGIRYRYNYNNNNNNNNNNNRNRIRNDSPFDNNNDDDFFDHGGATVCQDSRSTFQLRPNGRSITCSDLIRNEYALACTWDKVKSLCPRTCNEC